MKENFYYDISKKGRDLLGTGDVPVLENEQAIKESIGNLVATEVGTKVMDCRYGLNLDKYLFDPIDDFTAEMMEFDIREGILTSGEDRISDLEVTVVPTPDELSYLITINFTVIFSNSPQTFEVRFDKIR